MEGVPPGVQGRRGRWGQTSDPALCTSGGSESSRKGNGRGSLYHNCQRIVQDTGGLLDLQHSSLHPLQPRHDHQAVLSHTYSPTGLVPRTTQSSQAKPQTIQYSVMEQHVPIPTNHLQKVDQYTMSACTYNLTKIYIQDKLTLRRICVGIDRARKTSILWQIFVLPPDTFVHTHSSLSSRDPVYHISRCKLLKYFSTCRLLNTTTLSSDSNSLVSVKSLTMLTSLLPASSYKPLTILLFI